MQYAYSLGILCLAINKLLHTGVYHLMELCEKKYILFDLDGTVINSQRGIFNALDYTIEKMGIEPIPYDVKCRFIGPSIGASFIREFNYTKQAACDAVNVYREYYGTKGLYECEFYAGIENLAKKLKEQGKRIVIATKKPEIFAQKIISRLDSEKLFEFVCGSDENDTTEYKGYVLLKAMKLLGVTNKNEALMIGDTKYDCFGAKEAKIDCLGVCYGYGTKNELLSNGAVSTVQDMNELYNVLTGE